jgi:hypothetical protein
MSKENVYPIQPDTVIDDALVHLHSHLVMETGIAIPKGRMRDGDLAVMRRALIQMNPGDTFVWMKNNKHPYIAAKQVKCKIVTCKRPEGGWRI